MNTLQQNESRVETYLLPRLGRLRQLIPSRVVDPRHRQGRRYGIDSMLVSLLAGLLAGSPGLRDVERLSMRLGLGRCKGKISDTALTGLLTKLDDEALLPLQVAQVKDMSRRGQCDPVGLRQNWTTIDGKYQILDHHADAMAQRFEDKERKSVYWRLGVLRAVLVSAAGRPALGQRAIGPDPTKQTDPDKVKFTGEITNLWPFVQWLREQYGDLVNNFTLDAGLWSRDLFAKFDEEGLGIFGNVKKNKPELHAELARVLRIEQARRRPDAVSEWEPCKNGQIRRELWRAQSLDGWDGWTHLRQVLVVVQTTRRRDGGPDEVEHRYFATNMTQGALAPSEMLELVRRHWAIENDCNWTLDMQMLEDDGAWCTQNKSALALGVLRMIAYNLLQWLRKRHVQVRHDKVAATPMPWRELYELILVVLARIGDQLQLRLSRARSAPA